jgi:hypothetical protein
MLGINTTKYPGTALGIYFTAGHLALFLLAYVFNGIRYVLLLTHLPASKLRNGLYNLLGSDQKFHIAHRWLIAILLMSLFFIIYLFYKLGRGGFKKSTCNGLMILLIFVIHPLIFYIYQDVFKDFHLGDDPRVSSYLLNTFPFSSLTFLITGILIDRFALLRAPSLKSK